MGVDEVIVGTAARQHGAVARWQLADAGIAAVLIDERVRRRRLEPVERAVYRVPGLGGPRLREAAVVLSFGRHAVASHGSAGELQALVRASREQVVAVSVGAGNPRVRPGVELHRVRLPRDEIGVYDGIPATAPARTLLDLSGVLSARELEQALAAAVRAEMVTESAVIALLDRYPRRQGSAALRTLLRAGAAPAFTRSEAEERFLALVRHAELPAPGVNSRLCGYEVDFHWRAQRLVVEIDGLAYHTSRAAQQRDRQRDTALAAAGVRVLRFTWQDITARTESTLRKVVLALARGGL